MSACLSEAACVLINKLADSACVQAIVVKTCSYLCVAVQVLTISANKTFKHVTNGFWWCAGVGVWVVDCRGRDRRLQNIILLLMVMY